MPTIASAVFVFTVLAAVAGVCWYFCSWWYERHLTELRVQLQKTRQTAAQRVRVARHKASKLQRELQAAQQTIQGLQAHLGNGARDPG